MVMKSRRLKQVGHVALTGQMRNAYTVFVENIMERDGLEDLGVHGSIILKLLL
jgi:hypothetical protein